MGRQQRGTGLPARPPKTEFPLIHQRIEGAAGGTGEREQAGTGGKTQRGTGLPARPPKTEFPLIHQRIEGAASGTGEREQASRLLYGDLPI